MTTDQPSAAEWLEVLREMAAAGDEDAPRLLAEAFARAIGQRLTCWRCGAPAADFDAALKPTCFDHLDPRLCA